MNCAAKISFLIAALAAIAGCTEPVNPTELVRKKCARLHQLADEDQDLDAESQALARDSMEELCESAAQDCKSSPGGTACKKAIERLSMAP